MNNLETTVIEPRADGDIAEETAAGLNLLEPDFDEVAITSPINWDDLSPEDAEREWLLLNDWVEQIRHTFALPAQVIPPFWHRHPVLVEHLSALRTHHLAAFDQNQNASAPFGWIRDLSEWEYRARDVVARLGTRIDSDRQHQIPRWPGEPDPEPTDAPPPVYLPDRYMDFLRHLTWDINRRELLRDIENGEWDADAA